MGDGWATSQIRHAAVLECVLFPQTYGPCLSQLNHSVLCEIVFRAECGFAVGDCGIEIIIYPLYSYSLIKNI